MRLINRQLKKRRLFGIIASALLAILIIVCEFFFHIRDIEDLPGYYVWNITLDFSAMLVSYVIYVCCVFDVQKTGRETRNRYFFYMIYAGFLYAFTDAVSWMLEALPIFRVAAVFDNSVLYLCGPFATFFFWRFTKCSIAPKGKFYKVFDTFLIVGLISFLAAIGCNVYFGFLFRIDPNGIYSRGDYHFASAVYTVIAVLAVLGTVIAYRERLEPYERLAYFIYAMVPSAAGVFTAMNYGISLTPSVTVLTLLFLYCILNVTMGRQKALSDNEMSMAAQIQEQALPGEFPFRPDRKDFDLYAHMTPAKLVGGDFYDFYMIDEDHLALVIADVSGKGMPAALFMISSQIMIKELALTGKSPGEIFNTVNNRLCERNTEEYFVTAWMAILTLSTGEGLAVNAGHEHPALKRAGGEYELIKYPHGFALATLENVKYDERKFCLKPGDSIFVYTDGVTEASNDKNEEFGMNRMTEVLNRNPDARPEEVIRAMTAAIKQYADGAEQFDDITMLSFAYLGEKGTEKQLGDEK